MKRHDSLESYLAAPRGSYLAGATWLGFCVDDDLFGFCSWGSPTPREVEGLLAALDVELLPHVGRHASLVDLSRVLDVQPEVFRLMGAYLTERWSQFEGRVRSQVLVRPNGYAGSVVSGFYDVLHPSYPAAVCATRQAGLAHLRRTDAAAAFEAIDAAIAAIRGPRDLVGAVRELLRTNPTMGIDEAAARLAVSRRTLQRRLADSRTSFRVVATEARIGLARERIVLGDAKLRPWPASSASRRCSTSPWCSGASLANRRAPIVTAWRASTRTGDPRLVRSHPYW